MKYFLVLFVLYLSIGLAIANPDMESKKQHYIDLNKKGDLSNDEMKELIGDQDEISLMEEYDK